MSYISRNYLVAQKLEQLEQNRKKHFIAHSTGYQRHPIGFELKSVFKVPEVITGQNNVLGENSFSWIPNCWSIKGRTNILTSLWFPRRAGSKHVFDDLDRSILKFDLRSSQVKVMSWFRWVMLHISRRALTKQTHWYKPRVCISILYSIKSYSQKQRSWVRDLGWPFEGAHCAVFPPFCQ